MTVSLDVKTEDLFNGLIKGGLYSELMRFSQGQFRDDFQMQLEVFNFWRNVLRRLKVLMQFIPHNDLKYFLESFLHHPVGNSFAIDDATAPFNFEAVKFILYFARSLSNRCRPPVLGYRACNPISRNEVRMKLDPVVGEPVAQRASCLYVKPKPRFTSSFYMVPDYKFNPNVGKHRL